MKRIITGSKAFFRGLQGFKPKDTDTIIIADKPRGFKVIRQTATSGSCTFEISDLPKNELIEYALKHDPTGIQLGRFLTPEYAEHIGLQITDLTTLKPLVSKLDKKHQYQAEIYEAYIKNGDFTLTDEQRISAFEKYKEARTVEQYAKKK